MRQVTETGLGLRGDVILHTISIPTPYLCSIPCRSYVSRLISVVPHYLEYLISYYKLCIMTLCDGRTGPAADLKVPASFSMCFAATPAVRAASTNTMGAARGGRSSRDSAWPGGGAAAQARLRDVARRAVAGRGAGPSRG